MNGTKRLVQEGKKAERWAVGREYSERQLQLRKGAWKPKRVEAS